MAVNKDFSKFSWVYPGRNPKNFKGAIQEYILKDGSKIAIAFTKDGAYVLKDDQGYFATIDYIAKGGIFDAGVPIQEYNECKVIANVFIADTGNRIESIDFNEENIKEIAFKDEKYAKEDIEKRLRVVGKYGFFTVFTG